LATELLNHVGSQFPHPRLRGVCAIHTMVYIREGGVSSTSGRANRLRCRYVLLMVLWVLWSELLGDGKPEWNSIDTFNTQAECTEESQQRVSRAKQNRKVLNSGPTHFTYRSVNGTYMPFLHLRTRLRGPTAKMNRTLQSPQPAFLRNESAAGRSPPCARSNRFSAVVDSRF